MIHCAITTHAEGVPAAAYATVDGVCLPRCQMHIARARRDGCTVRLRPLTPEPATVTVTRAPVRPLPEPEPVMTDASKPLRSTPLNRSGATPNRHLPLILRPDADAHPELCRVADCTGKVKASGCCDTHGITIRRDGDPTAILKRADRSEAARRAAATRARVKGEAMATAPVVEQPGPAVPVEDGDGIVLARTDDPVTSVGENYTTPEAAAAHLGARLPPDGVGRWFYERAEAAAAHLGARLPDSVTESGVWVWVDFPAPAPTREQELQAQVEEQAGQIRRLEARIKGADATNDAMARSLSDIDSILDTTGAAPGQTTTERVRALASRTAPPPDQRLQAIAAELLADLDDVTDAGEAWGIHLVRALRAAVGVES